MAAILLLPSLNEWFLRQGRAAWLLFFYRSVEFFTTEGLVNLTYAALERIILLIGKPLLPPNFLSKH